MQTICAIIVSLKVKLRATSITSTVGCTACPQLTRADFTVKDQSSGQFAIINAIQNEMHSVHLKHIGKLFKIIQLKKATKVPRRSYFQINSSRDWKTQVVIVLTSLLIIYFEIAYAVP